MSTTGQTSRNDALAPVLTVREREVLELVRAGHTNSEVAERLGITRDAVRYHLKELHSKLQTDGERELLRRSAATRMVGWIGLGWTAAKVEVAATVALGAVALGGAGLAWFTRDHTGKEAVSAVSRPCSAYGDTGPAC
jgi:DNA-binding CsgD family transcriptional regulator